MTINQVNRDHGKKVATAIANTPGSSNNVITGIWHWINGVASGIAHVFGSTITSAFRTTEIAIKELGDLIADHYAAMFRLATWWDRKLFGYFLDLLHKFRNDENARIAAIARWLEGLVYVTTQNVLVTALRAVTAERHARQHAVGHAETLARQEIRSLHGVIEREAASGYSAQYDTRTGIIARLLDYAAARNPLISKLTGTLVTGLLDLASVDNPVARIFLGFLLKHVIDRLGIDRAAGVLISDLMSPLLGQPKPRGLHDVIADISARLIAMEKQWATFMEDGGSQVEQAGRGWRDVTSLLADAAIVGFTAQAVVQPDQWAREINDTIGQAANTLLLDAVTLFRG